MFSRIREKAAVLLAHGLPSGLAYHVALRVIAHAGVTRYAHVPARDITALQALAWWYESKVERNTFVGFAQLQSGVPGPPIFDRDGTEIHPRGDALEVLDEALVEEQRIADVALHPRIPTRG